MTETAKRPNVLWAALFLLITIAVGAHLSAIPLFLIKIVVAMVVIGFYAIFAVRIVSALQIKSAGVRAMVGLLLAAGTMYATWAVRIPAFSGWETAFTADPAMVLDAIVERANSMQVTGALGHGTTADGPSWLLLGTYILEALATVALIVLGSLFAFPEGHKQTEQTEHKTAQAAA